MHTKPALGLTSSSKADSPAETHPHDDDPGQVSGDEQRSDRHAATTAVVLLLIGTSVGMSWMLAYANVPQSLAAGLVEIADSRLAILLLINVAFLAVGMFIDISK